MVSAQFKECASNEANPNWLKHIERESPLYKRDNDIRSEYERDYTRILHSLAYRRLKHKTQVFFNIDNDHICTRMEHVQHVESVSCTIAKQLGLNVELTRAIAMGHDLGHAPFGHEGEVELTKIREEYGLDRFWHERNSLRIIDKIELLEDNQKNYQNLNLTYAVRDGIISHCGEVDENGIFPREEAIDLSSFTRSGEYQAYTWEGCVVKIADKIAYLGRDIEDALRMKFIDKKDISKLIKISKKYGEKVINTTVIIHNFIISICENSSPEDGIRLSEKHNDMLNEIKAFNSEAIYKNSKFDVYRNYAALVIRSIFDTLMAVYDGENTPSELAKLLKTYPTLIKDFLQHINQYSTLEPHNPKISKQLEKYKNIKIYGKLETKEIHAQAILDYISGMTDRYAIAVFNELLRY
jgi:dGTPase